MDVNFIHFPLLMISFEMWKCYHRFNSTEFESLLIVYIIRSMLWLNLYQSTYMLSGIMSKVDNKKNSIYFYCYTYLFTFFVLWNRSLKTKELTNQEIKDALRANNCTSVAFDEVKQITSADQHA